MKTKKAFAKLGTTFLWSLLTIITLFPIYWMILVSTRTPVELFGKPDLSPTFFEKVQWKNFTKPFLERYIDALIKEIEYVSKKIDSKRILTQVHWGGGTPNAISSLATTATAKLAIKVTSLVAVDFTRPINAPSDTRTAVIPARMFVTVSPLTVITA